MDLPIDPKRLQAWLATPLHSRPRVQDAFPDLTADEREFILTGATPKDLAELL